MARLDSPSWDEQLGVCTKHHLPQVPCPKCLAEHDPDVEVWLTETDRAALDLDPNFSIRDLLPAKDSDWLLDRVRSS